MSAITIDSDLVHYERLGRGRPVILVHGWLGSWRYWIPLMQHLHLKYSVYTLDLPGFGDSAKNPGRYTIAGYATTLSNFMDQLAIPKAAFIGHGLGAMVIIELAMRHPDKVAKVLLASLPLFDPGDLNERVPAGTRRLLTSNEPRTLPSALRNDAPTIVSAPASSLDLEATIPRRPATPQSSDAGTPGSNLSSAFHEAPTIARPEAVIDREKLLERAREVQNSSARNPLLEVFSGKNPAALLDKSFKRSEAVYEKLKGDVDKTDVRVLEASAAGYEAGRMLDNLRLVASPMCIVHGTDDPLLPAPEEGVWNYLTHDKEEDCVLIPLPGVRHFPMLEHEPFPRLVTDFLEALDLTKLEIRERWKRRSR